MTRDFIVGHGRLGAVDGQRHGLVGCDGEATGERQRQQHGADEHPQIGRSRFVELVQCIQSVVIPDSDPGVLQCPRSLITRR